MKRVFRAPLPTTSILVLALFSFLAHGGQSSCPMAVPPPTLTHDEPIEPSALPPTSDSATRSSNTCLSAETDEHLRSFTVSSCPSSRTISPTPGEEKGVEGPRESEHPIWEKDPANPLNWPIRRKWIAALAVCASWSSFRRARQPMISS